MQIDEMKEHARNIACNEHDVERAKVLCRDDIELRKLEYRSRWFAVVLSLVWGAVIVLVAWIVFRRPAQ